MSRTPRPVDVIGFTVMAVAVVVSLIVLFNLHHQPKLISHEITLMFCSQDTLNDGNDAISTALQTCRILGRTCVAQCTNGHTLTMMVVK